MRPCGTYPHGHIVIVRMISYSRLSGRVIHFNDGSIVLETALDSLGFVVTPEFIWRLTNVK